MANKIVLKKSSVAAKVPLSTDLEVGEIAVNLVDQKLYSKKSDGTVVLVGTGSGGSGDVTGAASSTDNAIVRFDGTTGKVIQNSSVIIDDSNNVSGVATLNATNIVIADNATLGSSNSDSVAVNGRITTDLEPNTTGSHDIGTNGRNWRDGFFSRNLAATTLNATDVNANSAIISANSSTNALRITQTGTGNALLVEDAANPDSTPFVVAADGKVAIGSTTAAENLNLVSDGRNFLQLTRASTDAAQNVLSLRKARGTNAAPTIVASGDTIGDTAFYGYDGVGYIQAGSVSGAVDGTPGTNDMPGRLVFSTTADGASSPTERMRIDSAGRVGIGGTPGGDTALGIYGDARGTGTANIGFRSFITVPSTNTGIFNSLESNTVTQAASFTLNSYRHYLAAQTSIGAGSTITNQIGFLADAGLTGATNNFGFRSNIASGTGRWNFYAAGSASNYFAGEVLINNPTSVLYASGTRPAVQINQAGATQIGISRFSDNASANAFIFLKSRGATVGSYTTVVNGDALGTLAFNGADGTAGITAAQISASVDGTPGTNDMPGRLVFSTTADGASSPTERMRIDNQGRVGIGEAAQSFEKFLLGGTLPSGSANTRANVIRATIPSQTTSLFNGFRTEVTTQAASFNLSELAHFSSTQSPLGAGSTVTNQYGFLNGATLTGATNNYGFFSNIPSGTGRWNFYAAGSADNYFAGNVGIGRLPGATRLAVATSDSPVAMLFAGSTSAGRFNIGASGFAIEGVDNTGTGSYQPIFLGGSTIGLTISGTERMRIDSAGRFGFGTSAAAGTFARFGGSITGSTFTVGIGSEQSVQSDVTSAARIFQSRPTTQATTWTLGTLSHFYINPQTFGAGTTVTNQIGFHVESSLTGATNNYGFYSAIASGTGRWNFYAAGSAPNYMAAGLSIGSPTTTERLNIYADSRVAIRLTNTTGTPAGINDAYIEKDSSNNLQLISSGGAINSNILFVTGVSAERMRITSNGSVGIGGTSFGSGALVTFIANATTVPTTNPSGGGIMYVEGGALKYRGSSGTVTTIANA